MSTQCKVLYNDEIRRLISKYWWWLFNKSKYLQLIMRLDSWDVSVLNAYLMTKDLRQNVAISSSFTNMCFCFASLAHSLKELTNVLRLFCPMISMICYPINGCTRTDWFRCLQHWIKDILERWASLSFVLESKA